MANIQVVRPRHEGNSDWGSPRIVLARRGSREVWWQSGHSYQVFGGYSLGYAPANMKFATRKNNAWCCEIVFEGRLTKKVVESLADRVAKFLLCKREEALRLHRKKTLSLGGSV